MSTLTPDRADPRTTVLLGSYRTGQTERVLYARRKGGWTYITDDPAIAGRGDIYAVERIPDSDGELAVAAVAADYLSTARRTRSIPMARTIIDIAEAEGTA